MGKREDTSNPLIEDATKCLFLCTAAASGTIGEDETAFQVKNNVDGSPIIVFGKGADSRQYLVPMTKLVRAAYEVYKARAKE